MHQLSLNLDSSSLTAASPTVATKRLNTTNRLEDGIFGWYKYIQDFTGTFAIEWISQLAKPGSIIWDPFSGSGTTLVAAKYLDIESYGYDVSPFMVDVARVKVDWSINPYSIERALEKVLSGVMGTEPEFEERFEWSYYDEELKKFDLTYPSDKKLSKWISPQVVLRFQSLLALISSIPCDEPERRLLRVAAASMLISASNMAFRPNICYERRPIKDFPVVRSFKNRVNKMLMDYALVQGNGKADSFVSVGDARKDGPEYADVIFTSPPYPNDMEYVHQTRLELTLLAYVEDTKGLTALKKKMISSSVKLVYRENEWQKTAGREIDSVNEIYMAIAKTLEGKNWGWNAADMTAQYFGGMRSVVRNWARRLPDGGVAAVVIGDSAFNGIKVPTDTLISEIASREGFVTRDIDVFRSRWNSKHDIELRESVVLLEKKRTLSPV